MKLYLMRHGEAEGVYEGDGPSLSARGESEVSQIGEALSSKKIQLDHIYHSGKLRARQTADIVGNKLSADIPISEKEGLKPNDPVSVFAKDLNDESGNILVVGHLPFVSKLTSYLLAETESELMFNFSPASVSCLEYAHSFGWNLHWLIDPESVAPNK